MNNDTELLISLKLRTFLKTFRAESPALWFLCFYILIEYIRPQAMYPVLDFMPWGQISLLFAFASVLATKSKANSVSALDTMFIIFSFLVILSALFAWSPATSMKYWTTYASWILMYFCIVSVLTTHNRIFLFIIFFILINFKLSQHGARSFAMRGFSFAHWGLAGAPGWFHNSGEFALEMVILFSLSTSVLLAAKEYITSRTRWLVLMMLFPGTSVLCVIGSSSRGGQIALVTVVLLLILRGKYLTRKLLFLAAIILIAWYLLPAEQLERFYSMGDDDTSKMRLEHWKHALETFSTYPFGIGYHNWATYYPSNFNIGKIEEIHNTVLQAFTELGYQGGVLFLLMLIVTFIMNIRTGRELEKLKGAEAVALAAIARGINLGLVGTFIAAFFMSVLYYPMFWLAFAVTSALRTTTKKYVENSKMPPATSRSNFRSKSYRNNNQ